MDADARRRAVDDLLPCFFGTCDHPDAENGAANGAACEAFMRAHLDVVVADAVAQAGRERDIQIEILEERTSILSKMLRYIAFVLAGDEKADSQLAADRTAAEIARLRAIVASAHAIRCQCGPLTEPRCRELQDMALRREP